MMDLTDIPVIDVSQQTHYRIKIGVDLTKKSYDDKLTNLFLLNRINCVVNSDLPTEIKYGWFQKSNFTDNYGIILVCSEYTEKIIQIYNKIKDDNLKVFAYEINSQITYLTNESRLIYKYYDFEWNCSLESFIQINPYAANFIHDKIKELIVQNNSIFAIGGEAGIYTKLFNKNYKCLTNSKAIYDDCLFNKQYNCELVDYNILNVKNHINNQNVLIVNISRNGLRNLADQIVNCDFQQILYIGCCDKAVKRDMNILKKRYSIKKIIKINQFPQTDYYSYIIDLWKLCIY